MLRSPILTRGCDIPRFHENEYVEPFEKVQQQLPRSITLLSDALLIPHARQAAAPIRRHAVLANGTHYRLRLLTVSIFQSPRVK